MGARRRRPRTRRTGPSWKRVTGIKAALQLLNAYYAKEDKAHDSADGAASGVICLLEVCMGDFSKNLAQTIADEESAVAEYEKVTKEQEIDTTIKNKSVHYKSKESKDLDQYSSELPRTARVCRLSSTPCWSTWRRSRTGALPRLRPTRSASAGTPRRSLVSRRR